MCAPQLKGSDAGSAFCCRCDAHRPSPRRAPARFPASSTANPPQMDSLRRAPRPTRETSPLDAVGAGHAHSNQKTMHLRSIIAAAQVPSIMFFARESRSAPCRMRSAPRARRGTGARKQRASPLPCPSAYNWRSFFVLCVHPATAGKANAQCWKTAARAQAAPPHPRAKNLFIRGPSVYRFAPPGHWRQEPRRKRRRRP